VPDELATAGENLDPVQVARYDGKETGMIVRLLLHGAACCSRVPAACRLSLTSRLLPRSGDTEEPDTISRTHDCRANSTGLRDNQRCIEAWFLDAGSWGVTSAAGPLMFVGRRRP
jgi:hypothetical protein